MTATPEIVVPIDAPGCSIELVGGKGRALATIAAAGLPVPGGFIVSTQAYRMFVRANDLQAPISSIVEKVRADDIGAADAAATRIRARFDAASMPDSIADAIRTAYAGLPGTAVVAVRSSATAEDLPGLSFAGQQDSFLNVRGDAAVTAAIQRCWASLWSARAIGYRTRMGVPHDTVAMGVVVQIMIDADVSGVLFTCNPTGATSELVISANFGLGESVVGGQAETDTFVLDRNRLSIKSSRVGHKSTMVVAGPGPGTTVREVPEQRRDIPALSMDQLCSLARLSLTVETLFGGQPQDIEWALAHDDLWLLQSRPITGLPERGDSVWAAPYPGARLLRRQVVENMPEPLCPLFEALYLGEALDRSMAQLFTTIGLPLRIDDFIETPMFVTVNGYGYCRYEFRSAGRMLLIIPRALFWLLRSGTRFLRNIVPLWREQGLGAYLSTIERWRRVEPASASAAELDRGIRELTTADASYWFFITMMIGGAKVTEGALGMFLSTFMTGRPGAPSFLCGFPSKTLEATQDLADLAGRIAGDPSVRELVCNTPATELLRTLDVHAQSDWIRAAIERHLETYGHRVYNLDFVERTLAEDPTPVLINLQGLVRDAGSGHDWQSRLAAVEQERKTQIQQTARSVGPVRRRIFMWLLRRAQEFGPYREEALYYMGAAWPTLRALALELGRRLTAEGTLSCADDVFYLEPEELDAACAAHDHARTGPDFRSQTADRRALREARRRLHPPARVPENLRLKIGFVDVTKLFETWETQKRNASSATTLHGFAVSAGTVTGTACVIRSPADFHAMTPGAILVCAATTPAWTPLFAQAAGLVTDIGGILAHGSIVAREYGIPAVLGTGNATERVVTGQHITVDGTAGTVTLHD